MKILEMKNVRERKVVEKDVLTFRVKANEHRYVVREPDPEDSWDQGEDQIEVNFLSAMFCPQSTAGGMNMTRVASVDYEEGKIKTGIGWQYKGTNVYLVVARYTSGCTFGHTMGNWEVEAVFSKEQQAEKYKREKAGDIEKKHADYFGGLEKIEIVNVPFTRVDC